MEHRRPRISIIAAIGTKTRALGRDNNLLWKIPGDLKRFKKMTLGHPIIMGSRTYESIGRPLPGRINIVLSRDVSYAPSGTVVVRSLEEALTTARENEEEEIFIIGGGQIFSQALPFVDKLYLTLVDNTTTGDVYFPDYAAFTKKVFEEKHPEHNPSYTFIELEKE